MAVNIKVRIDTEGDTHLDVNGAEGPTCETLTEALMRGMGDDIETTHKDEYVLENPDLLFNNEE